MKRLSLPWLTARVACASAMLGLAGSECRAQGVPIGAGPLRVGIATADITPEGSVWMEGFAARKKPSEGVCKPLYAVGSSTMAVNRRRVDDKGRYAGFQPEPRKPIDPDVPILRISSPEGKVRGLLFGYAKNSSVAPGAEAILVASAVRCVGTLAAGRTGRGPVSVSAAR